MLSKLKNITSKEVLVKVIVEQFEELIKGDYIPAVIKEGNLLNEFENSEDFYLKLIVVPKEKVIEDSWLQGNLNMSDIYGNDDVSAHNLVVYKNFKHEKIYQYNPQLYNDDMIWESDQVSLVFAQQNIEDSRTYNTIPVFKFEDNNNKDILLINSKVLENLNFFSKFTQIFELCLEFEYRFSEGEKRIESAKEKFNTKTYRGFIRVENNTNRIDKSTENGFTRVQGSIVIDINEIMKKNRKESSEIKVVNFDSSVIRDLNRNNYNDDTNAGLVVFKNECIDILKKEYHYNGINLIPKRTEQQAVIVDILDDIVVFWEGEFNRLPEEIQKELVAYNLTNRTEKIISKFMFTWQLEANFNFMDSALPNQKLGSFTYENFKNKAQSNNLEFWEPKTVGELKVFIDKIKAVFDITPNTFNVELEDIKLLEKIKTESLVFEINEKDLKLLMQKYCFAVLKYLEENNNYDK